MSYDEEIERWLLGDDYVSPERTQTCLNCHSENELSRKSCKNCDGRRFAPLHHMMLVREAGRKILATTALMFVVTVLIGAIGYVAGDLGSMGSSPLNMLIYFLGFCVLSFYGVLAWDGIHRLRHGKRDYLILTIRKILFPVFFVIMVVLVAVSGVASD